MEENKAPQGTTAVYSDYVGSLKNAAEPLKKKKNRKPNPNDWMRFAYPNREMRRRFVKAKIKYNRTPEEIKAGKSPFDKMLEVIDGNLEHGITLDKSFQNEVATDTMHFERSKDEMCVKSLTDSFGSELGMKMHNSNKRLQSIREDKKIMM